MTTYSSISLVLLSIACLIHQTTSHSRSSSSSSSSHGVPRPTPTPGCRRGIGRCGSTWDAANTCGKCCNDNSHCTNGDTCYADMINTEPCTSPPIFTMPGCDTIGRCGSDWADAANKCGQCCTISQDCTDIAGEQCFGDLVNEWTNTVCDGSDIVRAMGGCGRGQRVALTFDDGPMINGETHTIIDTINILNTLRAADDQVVGTFFVSPDSAAQATYYESQTCDLIGQLTVAGHEVQSHSWSHTNFEDLTDAQIKAELDMTSEFIMDCGGNMPTVFRPPFGAVTKAQAQYINSLGYVIAFWNLDTMDFDNVNDFAAIQTYIDLSKFNGDSVNVLMHDRSVNSVIEEIIGLFDGYEFITASQCYDDCDTLDKGICRDLYGNDFWLLATW